MSVAVIGADFRTAPIEIRERLAFGRTEVPSVLARLVGSEAVAEAVLLGTCNRIELYLACHDEGGALEQARTLLSDRLGGTPRDVGNVLYSHRQRRAAEHLFRVTAGLESMVLGEPQIQGQVKEAYSAARETVASTGPVVGPALNRLFQGALGVGGRIRSETDVGSGATSVASAAVELAKKIFGSLRGRRALVLGAGDTAEATLYCLRSEGVRSAVVANRTWERAEELADRLGARAIRWDDFGEALASADLVLCSTAAPHLVLTRERFRAALPAGTPRPLCIIDLAIPRDVEASLGDEPNVFLYNVDDLRQIVDHNVERRRAGLPAAETIIATGVEEFWAWYSGLAVVPTIRELRERTERLRQAELERALKRLAHLGPEDQQAIDALTRALANKLLHAPTVRLRHAAGNGRGTAVVDTARYLFELDSESFDHD
jgi:glutamyl-tRNA reductase